MRPLIRFALAQNVFFNLAFFILMAVGAYCLATLPVERYPEVDFGKVFISTFYRGATPTEVETLVTREIEDALEDMEDVEFIRSTSFRERSQVVVKFMDDTNYDDLYKELRFRVLGILGELPEDADPPTFNKIDTKDWLPVISVNLAGERGNRALTLMAEEMKIPLSQIPGVSEVKLQGEITRQFHVWLDPELLSRHGVTFDQAAQALGDANVSIPAGDYKNEQGTFTIKVDEKFRTREQVVQAIIRRDADGSFVRVGDVISSADVGYRDPLVITSVNGQPAVTLQVIKTAQGNALDIADRVREAMERFKPSLAREGVSAVLTQDSTTYIKNSIETLGMNLLVGVVLVSLIIWHFMGIRNAGLTTIGIPFSFLATMILMKFTGNSLNDITLFSFVLVSGMIVDDAIIVLENIYRHVQEGATLRDAIVEGTSEVFLPVVSATATTVAAFLPMLIMTGPTGEFFALIPKAVSFALLASLVECLCMLPIHYMDFGPRPGKSSRALAKTDNFILRLARAMTRVVTRFTLRFRVVSVLLVLLAFAAAMAVLGLSVSGKASLIKIKFFPDDYHQYYVTVEGPQTTPVENIDAKLREISRFIMADGPGMAASSTAFAGFYVNEDYENVWGANMGVVIVIMPAREDQHFPDYPANDPLAFLESMRSRLQERFQKDGFAIKVRPEKDGPPTGKDVNVRVVGPNQDAVLRLAGDMLHFMRTDPGLGPNLVDLGDDRGKPDRVFRLRVRKERAAEYGLTPAKVAVLAGSILDGRYVGKFRLPDEEVDLKVRVAPQWLDAPEAALRIPALEHPSGPVRLGDLCLAEHYMEPGDLRRYNGDRAVTISANIRPGASISSPAVAKAVRDHYHAIRAGYPGAGLAFGGEFEDTRRSYTSLAYAFGIAVLLIYMILATQFGSYLQPLIILSAVVFSLIGIVFGKLVTQTLFTVNSFVALVGVTGVVVNDSLVLIDFINRAYRSGLTRKDAIQQALHIRLRPIMLTTLTTTLGLLPMAAGFPNYSVVWGTMASTFVTGLCTATMLTLFIVPVLWDLSEGLKDRLRRSGARRGETDQTA